MPRSLALCGLGESEERQALAKLEDYKASLAIATVDAVPMTKGRPAHEVSLAEVLSRYLEAKRGTPDPVTGELKGGISRHHELAQRVETLLLWWGSAPLPTSTRFHGSSSSPPASGRPGRRTPGRV